MAGTQTTSTSATITEDALGQLRTRLRGTLLRPDSAGYDAARSVWNAAVDRRPAAIIQAINADDVIAAVTMARESGMPLSIRSGGHNIAGDAACEGGLMLDLSSMKRIEINAQRRTARAEPGVGGQSCGTDAPFRPGTAR